MHTGSEAEELGDRKLIGDKSAATPASGADTTSCVRVELLASRASTPWRLIVSRGRGDCRAFHTGNLPN